MKSIILWYSIKNRGDSSAGLVWTLTKEDAKWHNENQPEAWSETCIGSIESFEGSSTHQRALTFNRSHYE